MIILTASTIPSWLEERKRKIEVMYMMTEAYYTVAEGHGVYDYVRDDNGDIEGFTLAEALQLTGQASIDEAYENGIFIEETK